MNDHEVEIVVGGGAAHRRADVADHVALTLMSAGATVDFSARPRRPVPPGQTLCGVRAVVRMGDTAQPHMPPGPEQKSFDAPTAVRIAIGVVLLLALFGGELRLNFWLRLDAIIVAAVLWWFWRCRRRGTAMMP
ncbi:hypothetical protein [Acidocella sp.]|jgi:hypothetical protein|uniref:hypothetical protein n=1 Tax=Acidocella sp. TaxID=50710 RepID=UPI002F42216B